MFVNDSERDYYSEDLSSVNNSGSDTRDQYRSNHIRCPLDVSLSVNEEELMAMSRDSMKSTRRVNLEIDKLIKTRRLDTEDSSVLETEMIPGYSNHNINRNNVKGKPASINLRTLFEDWVLEHKFLDKSFILLWLNKIGQF